MALTIPHSGKPERPCRSNYPFNSGLVDQKTLVSKCERLYLPSNSIIHNILKKSTEKFLKINFSLQLKINLYSCGFIRFRVFTGILEEVIVPLCSIFGKVLALDFHVL